jgi:hypothetical protein
MHEKARHPSFTIGKIGDGQMTRGNTAARMRQNPTNRVAMHPNGARGAPANPAPALVRYMQHNRQAGNDRCNRSGKIRQYLVSIGLLM